MTPVPSRSGGLSVFSNRRSTSCDSLSIARLKTPVSRLSPSVFGQIGHLDFVLGNGSLSQYELEKDEDSYNFDYIGPASKVYLGFLAGKLRQLVLHLKVETTISIAQLPGLKIFPTVSRRYSSVRPEITIRGVTANKSKTSTLA